MNPLSKAFLQSAQYPRLNVLVHVIALWVWPMGMAVWGVALAQGRGRFLYDLPRWFNIPIGIGITLLAFAVLVSPWRVSLRVAFMFVGSWSFFGRAWTFALTGVSSSSASIVASSITASVLLAFGHILACSIAVMMGSKKIANVSS